MKLKRRCKVCGSKFTAIKVTQYFCRRQCFKRDYYIRTKNKELEQKQNPSYPKKICSFCNQESTLYFDPVENPEKFNDWECPHCHVPTNLIWKYQNFRDSEQKIYAVLETMQISNTGNSREIEYQTYYIPIHRLEDADTSVVVMSCDKPDIYEIQRGDRKKITFS